MKPEFSWSKWIDSLPSRGHSFFSLQDAIQASGCSVGAVRVALHRAMRDHKVAAVADGFYVVVPLEFRDIGAPPFEWVVEARFKRLGRPYYLGILTAAMLHGASHQKPMETQILVDAQTPTFRYGGQRIVPVFRRAWPSEDLLVEKSSRLGSFKISGPELTLVDLMRYPRHAAGLDNIANVIKDMDGKFKPGKLTVACKETRETPVLQRLGWMLRTFGKPKLAGVVAHELERRRMEKVPLEIGNQEKGPLDPEFKVLINHMPEPDV